MTYIWSKLLQTLKIYSIKVIKHKINQLGNIHFYISLMNYTDFSKVVLAYGL